MLDPKQMKQFRESGFVVLDGFFPGKQLTDVVRCIDAHMAKLVDSSPEDGSRNKPGHGMLVLDYMAEGDGELRRFCADSKFVELLTQLIGPDVRLYYNQAIYKPPENPREFPWHQDNGYTPVKPDEYITCWI